jgi:hypothetical protein
VSETIVKFIVFSIVAIFIAICALWEKPVTDCGKLIRKLCAVNALGWLLILPLSDRGHPPPFLFPLLLFWLVNLPLLPAAAVALWTCRKGREEKSLFLAVTSTYVVINMAVLFILPLMWLARE